MHSHLSKEEGIAEQLKLALEVEVSDGDAMSL